MPLPGMSQERNDVKLGFFWKTGKKKKKKGEKKSRHFWLMTLMLFGTSLEDQTIAAEGPDIGLCLAATAASPAPGGDAPDPTFSSLNLQ